MMDELPRARREQHDAGLLLRDVRREEDARGLREELAHLVLDRVPREVLREVAEPRSGRQIASEDVPT